MLPFDDPLWTELCASSNCNAIWLRQWLVQLLDHPDDVVLFGQDCWSLCSEEVTWAPAFAAAPYLVEIARRAAPPARLYQVCFLGEVAMYRVPPGESEQCSACPTTLEADFRGAIASASEMAIALLAHATEEADVRCLLAALAAFKGYIELARGIVDLQHSQRPKVPAEEIEF
ncbi:MAG: hypothetical protein R3B84_03430 [Zavarzinella sp.]